MKCPYCQIELTEDAEFCAACGKKIEINKKICPKCQNKENEDALFCSECGYNFQDTVKEKEELSRVKRKKGKNNKSKKKIYIIIGIIIALLMAECAVYFLFFKDNKENNEEIIQNETSKLVLEKEEFELEIGKQDYIEANMDCTYKVEDENIVEVDSFGTITAKSAGKTAITVKGENNESIKCKVTVKEGEQKIEIENYQASSTLIASGYNYSAENLYDNDKTTCWSEGVDGDGVGETITVQLKESVNINTLQIINGISKNEELYKKNGRLKKISLTFDDGSEENIEVSDLYNEFQTISFNSHKTKNIIIKINEVYQGTNYQDTCITELLFSHQNK